ncbi:uncharacterized protein LOC105196565 isoform X1 [Solenopsis invicta]|uniref:uncharacterized protein LOC105196565 isoform X1 n=2 Tax=Solenopsis invicta TaxID=13686 RepID=UPI00193D5FB2|nr:uncharacterized protein LOC105196565 isoform X1 [Solenopsis invicta]
MGNRLKSIEEYYDNLVYHLPQESTVFLDNVGANKHKALTEISALAKEIKVTDVNNFSQRFFMTASIIEKNLSLFKSVCEHVDVIATIIEYLKHFGARFMFDSKHDEYYKNDEFLSILITILNICEEYKMKFFLGDAIIKNSVVEKSIRCDQILANSMQMTRNNEMIILRDSDLYAVISYFRYRKSILNSLNKIWVQESIIAKFLWLIKEYWPVTFTHSDDIHTFRTKNELFTAIIPDQINIISIWTEDIVFAKNLAMHYISLNRDVLFINTHMDFYGGIVILQYTKTDDILYKLHLMKDTSIFKSLDDCTKKLSVQKNVIYNLFYDGMWQRPLKDTYWIHNDYQWANATSDDINKCVNSAKKGFKVWSAQSVAYRIKILSKFVSMLEYNGKSELADIISTWIKFSSVYENSLSCPQRERLEVTKIRYPKGVITLKEKDETVLFRRLTQILTVGNSVIVICDTNFCSLAPYCNMLSASEMPPGVVNLLSSETIKDLELSLCGMDYASYEKLLFSENSLEEIYKKLTKPKHIILPLK